MRTATRNQLIIGIVFVLVGAFIAYEMFYAMTPPRHADHDHAMAKLDAGGFLWVEALNGDRRNLVGRPDKVLVLHWFDPTANSVEQTEAARFAASISDDASVELVMVAQAPSWDGIEEWATRAEVPKAMLHLDRSGETGELLGIRRLPETLVYDPIGLLAHQARGSVDWTGREIAAQIERARAGVEEIH